METPPDAVLYDESLKNSDEFPAIPSPAPGLAATLRLLHDVLRAGASVGSADTISFTTNSDSDRLEAFLLPQPFIQLRLPARFIIRRVLGKGGFGSVYLAFDSLLKRDVAIKVPHGANSENDELKSRFLRESRAVARLNHPSIVRVLDCGESDSIPWQVAEYVSGSRLSDFRKESGGYLDLRTSALIIRQLADGVQHAHDQGVLHRDIKPDNVLLEPHSNHAAPASEGLPFVCRLTDFGLARLAHDDTDLSRSGVLIGTPKYMAPEQLLGRSSAQGPRTDVYALGVVLHELLTGEVPFPDADSLPSRVAVAEKAVPSFRSSASRISKDLETICLKCLHSRPEDRYSSAGALRDDLTRFLDGRPTLARPLAIHEQLSRWAVRNKVLASLLTLLLISIMSALALAVSSNRSTREQNRNLSKTLAELTEEKSRGDSLLKLANANRVTAEQHESKFRDLAWSSSIREAMLAMQQHRYHATRETLVSLRESYPDYDRRPDWQLAWMELQARYRVVFDAGHPLNAIAAIPGTPLLAVAGESYDIDIVDTRTQQRVRSITTQIHSIHALAVTSDGKRIAVGGRTNKKAVDEAIAEIYLLETGELQQSRGGHPTTIESLAFSHDGTRLVSGCRYEPLRIFNLVDGTELSLPVTRKNDWLSVTSDGSEVMALAKTDTIVIAPLDRPSEVRFLKATVDIAFCTQIPGTRIVACTEYQNFGIQFVQMDTGVHVGRLPLSGKSSACITASGAPFRVFVGRVDGAVVSLDVPDRFLSPQREAHDDLAPTTNSGQTLDEVIPVDSAVLMDSVVVENIHYSASTSGRVLAYELGRIPVIRSETRDDPNPWFSADIASTGDVLVGKRDGSLLILPAPDVANNYRSTQSFSKSINEGKALLAGKTNSTPHVGYSRDGAQIGWGSWSHEVSMEKLVDPDSTTVYPSAHPGTGSINAVCFSQNNKWMAWTGTEESVYSVETAKPTEFRKTRLPKHGYSLQYSPDSQKLAVAGSMDDMIFYDAGTMDVTGKLKGCTDCECIHWHPSGTSLLLGFVDGYVQFRSLSELDTENKPLPKRMIHQQTVTSIATLPASDFAVSVDQTAQVAIWNYRNMEFVGILFEAPKQPQGFVTMSPKLYVVDSGDLILVYNDAFNGPQVVRWDLSNSH